MGNWGIGDQSGPDERRCSAHRDASHIEVVLYGGRTHSPNGIRLSEDARILALGAAGETPEDVETVRVFAGPHYTSGATHVYAPNHTYASGRKEIGSWSRKGGPNVDRPEGLDGWRELLARDTSGMEICYRSR
jgi:hypothetical protein